MRRRMLLTGARGMVGRNLIEHPRASTWQILAPARSELDLGNFTETRKYVLDARPDVIVHAAGRVGGIQANVSAPVDFLVANVDMGRNIVLAAVDCGVGRLLNLASSCIYPRAADNPLREEMILTGELEPTNEGYALAKILTLRLGQYVNRQGGRTTCKTLVPCNLYGRYDKFDPGNSHLVPAILHKLHDAKIKGDDVVDVWGDGEARREFMCAADLADAVMRACEDFDAIDDVMNIGVGSDLTVNEYYRVAANVVGWRGSFMHDLTKPVGMARKLLDVSRQRAWGWAPQVSLEQGLMDTYKYYVREVACT